MHLCLYTCLILSMRERKQNELMIGKRHNEFWVARVGRWRALCCVHDSYYFINCGFFQNDEIAKYLGAEGSKSISYCEPGKMLNILLSSPLLSSSTVQHKRNDQQCSKCRFCCIVCLFSSCGIYILFFSGFESNLANIQFPH